ncbi:MAG: hypothetical protein ACR5K2_05060 [Wolbachia sp.]
MQISNSVGGRKVATSVGGALIGEAMIPLSWECGPTLCSNPSFE